MKFSFIAAMALVIMALTSPAVAADVESLLVDQCSSCHGPEVYSRKNRRVQNLHQLEKQLHRCNHAVGSKWDINTIDRVMDYLNNTYYHFKQ